MKKSELIAAVILVPIDFLMIVLAAVTAYFLRFEVFVKYRPIVFELYFQNYLSVSIFVALFCLLIFALVGLYQIGRRRIMDEISKVFFASLVCFAAIAILMFFRRELFSSRFIILAAWGLSFCFISFGRLIVRGIERLLYRKEIGIHRVIIIGEDKGVETLISTFYKNPGLGFKVIKRFKKFDEEVATQVKEIQDTLGVDEIIYVNPEAPREEILSLKDFCDVNHIVFKYSADLFAAHVANVEFSTIAGVPLIEIKRTRLEGWGRIYKRIFDIIGSLILIILTSPIMILTAIAIKLDSRGPVFWSKLDDGSPVQRVGQYGKLFHYFKFRSMRPGTHHLRYTELATLDFRKGPLVKIKEDPRVTRVGRFIRKWSIDELPELFLVLIGKMSLVGPRPHLPEEVAKYKKHHRKVLAVKPGMTGLAQISGREDLDFEEEVRLDTFYIENWSLKLDLYILLKTPFVVLKGKAT
jgi:exopolysaccharide biosynthesis polyprenyl glycosylphosphotransferase